MTFQPNSHETGKKGELRIQKLLNDTSYFFHEVERRGGTRNKADFYFLKDLVEETISGKSKATLKTGSFDYANITSCNFVFNDHFDEFEAKIRYIRSNKSLIERKKLLPSIRKEVKELIDKSFIHFSKEILYSILHKSIVSNIDHIIVDDRSASIFYHFYPEQHPFIKNFDEIESAILIKKSSTPCMSRTLICITKDGMEHDYSIRFRVCYNNGITALLGLNEGVVDKNGKPKNNNASLCIKVQQDKTFKLLNQQIDCNIVKYHYDQQSDKYFRIT